MIAASRAGDVLGRTDDHLSCGARLAPGWPLPKPQPVTKPARMIYPHVET